MRDIRAGMIALAVLFATPGLAGESLGQWLSQNSQKVKRYLLSLKTSDLGRRLRGIRLTNGEQALEGHVFLSARYLPEYKARVFVFREPDGKTPVAWVWVEQGGKAMPLPSCEPDKSRPDWFVWSGAVISGDSYTFSEVQPGGDVVITHCLGETLGDGLPVGKH
ncbi:MAG TPA: hypothetical protein ENK00_02015 [Chromatiales bacterium]|nr:hypothetical protein [Chromatiales bacterium]